MPEQLDDLKKTIEGKNRKKGAEQGASPERVDPKQVDRIVERIKKKYGEQGVEFEQVGGRLGELRTIIAEGEQAKISVQTVEELQEFRSPLIKQLGRFYIMFRGPMEAMSNIM